MGTNKNAARTFTVKTLGLLGGGLVLMLAIILMSTQQILAQSTDLSKLSPEMVKVMSQAFLSAAMAVVGGSLAAGIAVAYVGAAAVGAVAEKPEVTGRVLIFVGLAEGIAIYGLIIAIMIMGRV